MHSYYSCLLIVRRYCESKKLIFLNRWKFFSRFSSRFIHLTAITAQCTVYSVQPNLYINLACLSVCLFVCLFVSNKRQNGWTDRAQIFCGTPRKPREGLWMIKFSKICLHQNSIFESFKNPRNFFLKIREIFCFCYLLTRRTTVYFISNTNFYKWNKKWARSYIYFDIKADHC